MSRFEKMNAAAADALQQNIVGNDEANDATVVDVTGHSSESENESQKNTNENKSRNEKRRDARKRKAMLKLIAENAKESEQQREKEAKEALKQKLAAAIAAKKGKRLPEKVEINPDTGLPMDKTYKKEFTKYLRNNKEPYMQLLKEFGVDQQIVPLLTDLIQKDIIQGKIKDTQQIADALVKIFQSREGQSYPTVEGSTAHQIQQASRDGGVNQRIVVGPPPKHADALVKNLQPREGQSYPAVEGSTADFM